MFKPFKSFKSFEDTQRSKSPNAATGINIPNNSNRCED
jgi:hypothetical protein